MEGAPVVEGISRAGAADHPRARGPRASRVSHAGVSVSHDVDARSVHALGLTAVVAVLVAVVTSAALRFVSAARESRSGRGPGEDKLSAALQEAVTRLQAQGAATAARGRLPSA